MAAPVTIIAATTPGRAATAAASAPGTFTPLPVIVAWAEYMVVPSQTSPRNSWARVPVATGAVSVVSLAMYPTSSTRRIG